MADMERNHPFYGCSFMGYIVRKIKNKRKKSTGPIGGMREAETFYLVDFENVHDKGLENIVFLKPTDHVHIFSTGNALKIRMDVAFAKGVDVKGHIVPIRKQSLDMHLASYLGYLLGIHGKKCSYVIVSKDTDYDNIIKFWKEEGWPNISRKEKISEYSSAITSAKAAQNSSGSGSSKKEAAVRSFLEEHLKEKHYVDQKEKLIKYITTSQSKQQLNNRMTKLYADGKILKHFYQTVQPLIKDLPGK